MSAIAALLGLVLATGAQAQSPNEKSELNEQCGKRATEVFTKKWDDQVSVPTDTGWTFTTYQNHYNSRSNKCFYLLKREGHWGNYRDNRGLYKIIMLVDLDENRGIGSYEGRTTEPTMEEKVIVCSVQDKECKSEEEFRALIKPFMED
jgi:hypothetical protein